WPTLSRPFLELEPAFLWAMAAYSSFVGSADASALVLGLVSFAGLAALAAVLELLLLADREEAEVLSSPACVRDAVVLPADPVAALLPVLVVAGFLVGAALASLVSVVLDFAAERDREEVVVAAAGPASLAASAWSALAFSEAADS